MDVLALVAELAACDPSVAHRDELVARATASGHIRAWLDAFDIEVGRALDAKTGYGQKILADATNISMHAAEKVLERGRTLRELPRLRPR